MQSVASLRSHQSHPDLSGLCFLLEPGYCLDPNCCQGPCLVPWPCCSYGLYWCLWPLSLQGGHRNHDDEIRRPRWVTSTLFWPWDNWPCFSLDTAGRRLHHTHSHSHEGAIVTPQVRENQLWWQALSGAGSDFHLRGSAQEPGLSSSTTTRALGWVLELMAELVLRNDTWRTSMNRGGGGGVTGYQRGTYFC